MNEATLMGLLKSDPDLKWAEGSSGQTAISRASIGIFDRNNVESTLEVKVWGDKGKEFAESCRKDQRIVFTGSLQIELRELPSGVKNKYAQLVVSNFVVVGGETASGNVATTNFGNFNDQDDDPDIDLDDIPF